MFNNNLLMGAAAAASGGASVVSVGNSSLFTSNSQELERTPSGAGNVDKWTFSTWVYFGDTTNSTSIPIFGAINTSANQNAILISSTGQIYFQIYLSSAHAGRLITTQLLRDIGWYHIVVVYDSGNAIASNREIIYLNGERVTEFATEAYVSQNLDGLICGTHLHQVGMFDGLATSLNGYLAETVLLDGTATGPTSFGVYDSSGLFWTPLASATIKELTFGTTGFYLDNTTNAQTDASGQGNNFTNTGSVTTVNYHTPTKLGLLVNNLFPATATTTYLDGNKNFKTSATSQFTIKRIPTTLTLPDTGKWILGFTLPSVGTSGNGFGLTSAAQFAAGRLGFPGSGVGYPYLGYHSTTSPALWSEAGMISNAMGTGVQAADEYYIAVDLDNTKAYGGFWDNSASTLYWYAADGGTDGNPATGDNPSNTIDYTGGSQFTMSSINNVKMGLIEEADISITIPTGFSYFSPTNVFAATTRTASDTTKYFDTILYEGNGNFQRVGQFQPFTDSFTIANSAVFNHSGYLTRTQSSPTDQDVWTLSWWMKASNPAALVNGVFGVATANQDIIYYTTALIYLVLSGTTEFSRDIDDSSQWQHIMFTNNSGTLGFYWNGQSQGSASGSQHSFNSAVEHSIGSYNGGSGGIGGNPMAAYMADVIFVDGTVHPVSVFGQTDTTSGRWVPKDPTTTLDEASDFGNNGYFLNFANSSDMGNDVSGNNHDWTTNNTISQSTDTPTSNFAILDPSVISGGAVTLSAGNLTQVGAAATVTCNVFATLPMRSGKWIMAGRPNVAQNYEQAIYVANETGVAANTTRMDQDTTGNFIGLDISTSSALETQQGAGIQNVSISPSFVGGTDYTVLAMDADNKKVYIGWHDVSGSTTYWLGDDRSTWNGNPATGAGAIFIAGSEFKFVTASYSGRGGTVDFGQGTFLSNVTIPTGYLALSQDNMTSSDQFISAFSWIKNRDATDNHMLFDRVRGVTKDIHSNTTDAQVTNVQTVQEFLAGGVQVGTDVQVNTANESYVLWNWMIEATGSGSANTAGSVNTTSTLVDTTLGCSISQFECPNDSNDFTIGHGLGAVPKVVLLKSVDDGTYNWSVFHASTMDNQDYLKLNSDAAQTDYGANIWGAAVPTSTVIGITANVAVLKNTTCICYAFADSQFIATGKYTGNGNADGPFIPTVNSLGVPIQPRWVMFKSTDAVKNWYINDVKRNGNGNPIERYLIADLTLVGGDDTQPPDFVTGGVKWRGVGSGTNGNGTNYVYIAMGTPIIDTDGRIIAGR